MSGRYPPQGPGGPRRPSGRPSGRPGPRPPRPGAKPDPLSPDKRYHALVSLGANPFYLRPGQELTIGRNKECGLTVPSKRVSRQHAQIFWRAGLPVLKNLSENSETIVNGSAVNEHELRHRDEIQVGPYLCTYTFAPGFVAERWGEDQNQATMVASAGEKAAMRGALDSMSVKELLLGFEHNESTGTLRLRPSEGEEGVIVIEKGGFHSVTHGSKRGEGALRELIPWTEGTFQFNLEKQTAPLKLIRKFDYSATSSEDTKIDLKRVKISDYLEWFEGGCRGKPRERRRPPRGSRGGGGGRGGAGRGGGDFGGGGGGVPGRGW